MSDTFDKVDTCKWYIEHSVKKLIEKLEMYHEWYLREHGQVLALEKELRELKESRGEA